jgi:phage terminase large subunit-like protein
VDKRDPRFAIAFIEGELVFSEGEWTGKPARLTPWEKRLVRDILRLGPDGRRQHTRALLGIGRRNGKSQLAGWLAAYFAVADGEPSPLVIVAAATDHQADVVFAMARKAIELGPLAPVAEFYEREIVIRSTPGAPGRIRRVACTTGDVLGASIHAAVLDELHDWRGHRAEEVYAGIIGGTGARSQPFTLAISTAGYDEETICGRLYRHGLQVEAEEATDPSFYFKWYEAPPGADIGDVKAWKKANPNLGVTIPNPDRFIAQQVAALRESEVRRWHLNQWVAVGEPAFGEGVWDACAAEKAIEEGTTIVVGLDGSYTRGGAALMGATLEDEVPHIFPIRLWEAPDAERDFRIATADVIDAILEATKRFDVRSVAADEITWRDVLRDLEDRELPATAFANAPARQAAAFQAFSDAVHEKRLTHDGDARVSRHVAYLTLKTMPDGVRPVRPTRPGAFDHAARAAIIGYDRTQAEDIPRGADYWLT